MREVKKKSNDALEIPTSPQNIILICSKCKVENSVITTIPSRRGITIQTGCFKIKNSGVSVQVYFKVLSCIKTGID